MRPATLPAPDLPAPASASGEEQWLVVDQLATAPADFAELLNEIHRHCGLDPYSARQRLLGRGYNLLLRGSSDRLGPLLALLNAHGIPARLLAPLAVKTHPAKLQSLRRSSGVLTLVADNAELTIDGDVHVVAVFADLSGAVVAKQMKQLLVRHAYQGNSSPQPQDEEVICRAIAKAQPVLDLYLLDAHGEIRGAVRALPGGYDAGGLGAERSLSAGLNLLALLEIARQSAGRLTLRCDFGLANLPGCQLDTPLTAANRGKNLAALSRFGSLAAQFAGQSNNAQEQGHSGSHARKDNPPAEIRPTVPSPALPPPPEGGRDFGRRRFWHWGDTAGVVFVFIVLAIVGMGRGHLSSWFWHNGITSGAVPAFLSLLLLWRGFAAVHLKRRIENTPVSRIRSLATGMVEVCGRAERCYALVTPVTQIPCIYYRLRRYRRDEGNNEWQMTREVSSGRHPFWLHDATGKVLIDPTAADLCPATREEGTGTGAFLALETSSDSDEMWVEESIPEGEQLYVLGFATPRRRDGESLHAATAARLRTLKGSSELRQRFDQNGDGKIDADEWDEVRRVTADEVAQTRLAGGQHRRKQEEALVIGAPPHRSLPFLIAQSLNEGALTRALWWRALVFFGAGLLLMLWALRQLLHFLPAAGY